MRTIRALIALLASLLLGVSLTAALPAAGEELPQRVIEVSTKQKDWRTFVLKGTVQDHAEKKVLIQKKKCGKCKWKIVDKTKTNDRSKFRAKIYAPVKGKWFWRAKVNGYGGYAPSYSEKIATYLQ